VYTVVQETDILVLLNNDGFSNHFTGTQR